MFPFHLPSFLFISKSYIVKHFFPYLETAERIDTQFLPFLENIVKTSVYSKLKDNYDNNLLILASKYNHKILIYSIFKTIDIGIINGIINEQNKLGYTALMYACQNGDIETVKWLTTEGLATNPALTNQFGDTAYTLTALYNHTEIMKLLLKFPLIYYYKTNLLHKNNFGYSALDYAKMNNNLEMIELLEKESRAKYPSK
jgi:ankyrin repeat protein